MFCVEDVSDKMQPSCVSLTLYEERNFDNCIPASENLHSKHQPFDPISTCLSCIKHSLELIHKLIFTKTSISMLTLMVEQTYLPHRILDLIQTALVRIFIS